jgi:nicotinate-nucleotide adenylyltransferase
MREFRLLYGPDADLYFITGADAMLEIFSWKEPEELFSLCNFIVATRPGYDLQKLQNNIAASFIDKVSVLEIPLLSISSTDIRDRVKKSRSIRYLVPEAVDYYVHQNGIYRQEF